MNGTTNADRNSTSGGSLAGQGIARPVSRQLVLDQDVNEVTLLYERLFQKQTDREMWKWKYCPPWTSKPYAWVTTVADRIIGHIGAVPLRGQLKGEETLFFQLGDVMADPTYRSMNIYQDVVPTELARDVIRDHPSAVFYGFTSERLGLWYAWFTSQGRTTFMDPVDDRIVRLPANNKMDREKSPFDICEWPWDAPELDELWLRHKDTIRVGLVRDRAYLQWRYATHPLYEYNLFGVHHDGSPIGWFVTAQRNASDDWDDEVRIQDFLLDPAVRIPVLRQAAPALRAKSLVLWLPSNELSKGVESRSTGWHVMYHCLAQDVSKNFLARRVFFTLGEADQWWW